MYVTDKIVNDLVTVLPSNGVYTIIDSRHPDVGPFTRSNVFLEGSGATISKDSTGLISLVTYHNADDEI